MVKGTGTETRTICLSRFYHFENSPKKMDALIRRLKIVLV